LLSNLATLYHHQGRYAEAELVNKRSLAIKEKALGPDHSEVAQSLNNLATLYYEQGRYADAGPLFKRALAIREKVLGPDHPDVAESLNNLAEVYKAAGDDADAEPLLKRALAIEEKALGPDHPRVATSLNNLAELYRAQARYADAEPLYERSLAIEEKAFGHDHPIVASALSNMGVFYDEQGRDTDAERELKRSLAIEERTLGPDHPDVANSLNNLAVLYDKQRRYADAEQLYKRSLAIQQKAFGPDHPDSVKTLNNLAGLYKDEGRYDDALVIVQSLITHNQAVKFIALDVLYGLRSQNLIAATEALESSYTVLQRSVSSAAGEAVSKLAARFAAGSDELAELVRKDQDLSAEADQLDKNLIAAISKPPAARSATAEEQTRKRIEEIRLQRDKLQDIFNKRFPDYVALLKPQPLTVSDTQALLANDEALIAFDFGAKSYVWIVTKDRAEWRQLAISADDVSKVVATLRSELDPNSLKPFDAGLAYQLYKQVLGPIADLISNKTRLSFILSGALTSLPPQVLVMSDPTGTKLNEADWFVRKYAITVLPSTASLKTLREAKSIVAAAKPMIGFGDPVFDRTGQTTPKQKLASLNRSLPEFYRGAIADAKSLAQALPPLPETADELRTVAKELGASPNDINLGESANVTNVKHLPLDKYHVVYFATHALVAGEVERFAKTKAEPALVLSIPEKPSEEDDGLLRASDVAMLKMNADFVVLSACNTAAGVKPGAEALSGLARAFFYAGARSLVVSNWEVDSEATVALMTGLFDASKTNPHLSHAEALRLSILQMINNPSKPEWGQPKYWAPFIVVGEPQKS
jgi:CHAT domain-containing protein/Tfp pilus assembly protein PilF